MHATRELIWLPFKCTLHARSASTDLIKFLLNNSCRIWTRLATFNDTSPRMPSFNSVSHFSLSKFSPLSVASFFFISFFIWISWSLKTRKTRKWRADARKLIVRYLANSANHSKGELKQGGWRSDACNQRIEVWGVCSLGYRKVVCYEGYRSKFVLQLCGKFMSMLLKEKRYFYIIM